MHSRERDLFLKALDWQTDQERGAFLARECGGDTELQRRVEDLLHHHLCAGDFLENDGLVPEFSSDLSDGQPNGRSRVIGRYHLLEKIGEGGFGVVYMAEQRDPVKRRVALKVIKPGMDSRQVIGRFEAERQALALMDHPNIARVFDGGATDNGLPYFVMELVRGVPITQFCDEQQLDTRARLALFVQVCNAIQHAHQKGILHRDIKPTNVLATLHDDVAVPKVIDFGIAKAMQGELTGYTVFTRFHEFVGTPAYVSPEQAEFNGLDVDTRSDIYSLGVLLYELLTSRTPFDARELLSAGFDEMRRRIREEEPMRPSTRIRGLRPDDAVTMASNRRSQPARLISSLRGDLDWIVLKCLEKDRCRRYDSAGDLARDIQRHLRNESVTAVAPSITYEIRKLTRRHRTWVGVTAGFLLLLLAGTVVTGLFAWRTFRAEQKAVREAAVAEAVSRFLNEDLFNQGSLESEVEGELTLRTLLDRAATQAQMRFGERPEIEAAIHATLGRAYHNLGDLSNAEIHRRRALDLHEQIDGPRDPKTLRAESDLAQILAVTGRKPEALASAKRVLAIAREELGSHHPLALKFLSRFAVAYYQTGDTARAREAASGAVEFGRVTEAMEVEDRCVALDILGRMLARGGDLSAGEKYVREALDLAKRHLGPTHPFSIRCMNGLAAFFYNVNTNRAEAESLYRDALDRQRRAGGESHPLTLAIRDNLVLLYLYREPAQPESALTHSLSILENTSSARQRMGSVANIREALGRIPIEASVTFVSMPGDAWLYTTTRPTHEWTSPTYNDRSWTLGNGALSGEAWIRQPLRLRHWRGGRIFVVAQGIAEAEVRLNDILLTTGSRVPSEAYLAASLPRRIATLPPSGEGLLTIHAISVNTNVPVRLQVYGEAPADREAGSW